LKDNLNVLYALQLRKTDHDCIKRISYPVFGPSPRQRGGFSRIHFSRFEGAGAV